MNTYPLILSVLAVLLPCACNIVPLVDSFSVTACSVGDGTVDVLPETIRIDLNDDTTLSSAVSNLALTEDGLPLYCNIELRSRGLLVTPWRALREDSSYHLVIGNSLRSIGGQTLEKPFSRAFKGPVAGENRFFLDEFHAPSTPGDSLLLGFPGRVSPLEIRRNISIYPDWPHRLEVEDNGDGGVRCRLLPVLLWPEGKTFTVMISTGGVSLAENPVTGVERRSFTLGKQNVSLRSLRVLDADGALRYECVPGEGQIPVIHGVPKDFAVSLEWESPRLLREVDGVLMLGAAAMQREGAASSPVFREASSVLLLPAEEAAWGDRIPLWTTVGALFEEDTVWIPDGGVVTDDLPEGSLVLAWLVFDDPAQEPPAVQALRYFFFDEEGQAHSTLVNEGDAFASFVPPIDWYPLDAPHPFAVEFFVSCAPDCGIDPVRFIEMVDFRFDSTAFSLSIDSVRFSNFVSEEVPQGMEGCWRCEFSGSLINREGRGLASFEVPAGIPDTAGTVSRERFLVTLCK